MRTITSTVYLFSELSETAKEVARDWFRQTVFSDPCDWEHVYEDAIECGQLLGIDITKIYYSGFSSQGDGACFIGSYKYQKGAVTAIKAHAPQDTKLHQIAYGLQSVQKRHFYQLKASCTHSGHYQHSGCMHVDVSKDTEVYNDYGEDEITQLLRDFADWIYIYTLLETEYDYQMSDESVDKNIIANAYEFTVGGKRV